MVQYPVIWYDTLSVTWNWSVVINEDGIDDGDDDGIDDDDDELVVMGELK